MLVSSLFFWSFLGTSFLLCSIFLQDYWDHPQLTIRTVLGGSLLASLGFATMMTLIARRYTFSRMLERMTAAPISLSGIVTGFVALSGRMGVSGVSLREALFGSAFSISLSGQGVVAMSPELAGALSSDETDAVLAHELSHIKNGDSDAKGLAKLARVAFPFDPVLRLVEAAVHRERELWADKVSVEFTEKPLALASAIVKANSGSGGATTSNLAGLFVGGSGHGLLSPYPNLERRVDILLELARRMEIANSPLVAA
jgi:Zn-dependent protease with chaperone function